MRTGGSKPAVASLMAGTLLLAGCPSAYQRAYQQETEKLEAQQQIATEQAEAAHAQAQRYAAVIYFAVGSSIVDGDGERELRWFVQQMLPYPQAIIEEILAGMREIDPARRRYRVESDRSRAIGLAVADAGPGDLVLIAGKGHETVQIVRGRRLDFDDRAEALAALLRRGYAGR